MDLRGMMRGVDDRLRDMHGELSEAVRASRAGLRMLHSLLSAQANDNLPPRLMWITPVTPHSGWRARTRAALSPRTWFTETVMVTFICPVTLKVAAGGPNGAGFPTKRTKQEWATVLPYLQAGLTVIKLAMAGGRLLGLPLPCVGDVSKALGVGEEAAEVERMYGFVKELQSELGAPGVAEVLESAMAGVSEADDDAAAAAAVEAARDAAVISFRSIVMMMDGLDVRWRERCGLRPVTAQDGTFEWVCPEAVEVFRVEGANGLLR